MAFRFYFSAHKQQQCFPHHTYNLQLNPGITQVFISTCDGQLGEHRATLTELQAPDNGLQSSPTWIPADLWLLWVKLHMPAGKLLVIQRFTIPVHNSSPHSPIQWMNDWWEKTSWDVKLLLQVNTRIPEKNLPVLSHAIHVQTP